MIRPKYCDNDSIQVCAATLKSRPMNSAILPDHGPWALVEQWRYYKYYSTRYCSCTPPLAVHHQHMAEKVLPSSISDLSAFLVAECLLHDL